MDRYIYIYTSGFLCISMVPGPTWAHLGSSWAHFGLPENRPNSIIRSAPVDDTVGCCHEAFVIAFAMDSQISAQYVRPKHGGGVGRQANEYIYMYTYIKKLIKT